LLAVVTDQTVVEELWSRIDDDPSVEVTIDLENKVIQCDHFEADFEIDDYTRWRLLEGLDDIGITLGHEDQISAYESARPPFKPSTVAS
jgi:3-isopropylmalate/(R)-2-methylmalate dehydratase small subunit